MPHVLVLLLAAGSLAVEVAGSLTSSLVADINPYGGDGEVRSPIAYNSKIYFFGDKKAYEAASSNVEVLSYDPGTGAVAAETTDLPYSTKSEESSLCEFNGTIYMRAKTTSNGIEIVKVDLDAKTSIMVADVYAGYTGSEPASLTVYGDRMYFGANADAQAGRELYVMDVAEEVTKVHEFSYTWGKGGDPKYLTVFQDKLYMQADSQDGSIGVELYVYDKADNSVTLAANINPGGGDSNPAHMAVFDDKLYMSADGGDGAGQELWSYDGTNAPIRVVDIVTGSEGSSPEWLTVFDGSLYFAATTPATGQELFRLDGAAAVLVAEVVPGSVGGDLGRMAVLDGVLYTSAFTVALGRELHRMSASGDAIELVVDVYPALLSAGIDQFTVHEEQLFFVANDGVHGKELWKYNSTHGAHLAVDIVDGSASSSVTGMLSFNGSIFMGATLAPVSTELVQFDPRSSAFTLLADIYEGSQSSNPSHICELNGNLYFSAAAQYRNVELWNYTREAGATLVADLSSASGGSAPQELTALGGIVYFSATTTQHGRELWKYTPGGEPELIEDFAAGTMSASPAGLMAIGNELFFLAVVDTQKSWDKRLCKYNPSSGVIQQVAISGYTIFSLPLSYQGTFAFRATSQQGYPLLVLQADESVRTGIPDENTAVIGMYKAVEFEGDIVYSTTADATVGEALYKIGWNSVFDCDDDANCLNHTNTDWISNQHAIGHAYIIVLIHSDTNGYSHRIHHSHAHVVVVVNADIFAHVVDNSHAHLLFNTNVFLHSVDDSHTHLVVVLDTDVLVHALYDSHPHFLVVVDVNSNSVFHAYPVIIVNTDVDLNALHNGHAHLVVVIDTDVLVHAHFVVVIDSHSGTLDQGHSHCDVIVTTSIFAHSVDHAHTYLATVVKFNSDVFCYSHSDFDVIVNSDVLVHFINHRYALFIVKAFGDYLAITVTSSNAHFLTDDLVINPDFHTVAIHEHLGLTQPRRRLCWKE